MKTIVVIGAGPAGAVAASYLARQGYQVLVLEKVGFPRFVIGESLLPLCMEKLEEAGLMDILLTKGFQKKSGATFFRNDQTCTFLFSQQYTESWPWTWQVQRVVFDQTLVDGATANGAEFRFDCEVTAVELTDTHRRVTYRTVSGESHTVDAAFVIDASGYGRVLPRLLDLEKPSVQPARGAVFAHLEDPKRIGREAEDIYIYPFDSNKSWIWVIPFADGTSSVGIVGDNDRIRDFAADGFAGYGRFIREFELLKDRFAEAAYIRTPTSILGYSIGVKRMYGPGFALCGNSTEFLDPVFSSGVTLAATSGLLAAKLAIRELGGEAVDWQVAYEDKMQEGIEVFRSYVDGWYSGDLQAIFFNHEISRDFKEQICSVLAGHVWDTTNPFVKKHRTILRTLAKVISIKNKSIEALLKEL